MYRFIIRLVCVFVVILTSKLASAETKNGFCTSLKLADIPVGNFHQPLTMPIEPMRITQGYNTSKAEGYCQLGNGSQPPGSSSSCRGRTIYYGHDGLDLHPQGAVEGVHDVLSVQPGLVVASHQSRIFKGWGESVIIATRANFYSEEILTFHYHHLYNFPTEQTTSRLFGPCDQVAEGRVIAKEGGTPDWPTHLHVTVRRWKNLRELTSQISNSPTAFYGYGYSFGNNARLANYLDPEGLLYDHFSEFQEDRDRFITWQWSDSVVREMRAQGWFFGNFDGSFGVDQEVKRRDAARWFKQALRLPSAAGLPAAHFQDLPTTDADFPYVQTLLQQTATIRVINPERSCTASGRNFCPEQNLNRAEALKMIIAGFYQDKFLEVYNNWVWRATASAATQLLSRFSDVNPQEWFAPYVYFAWQNGLIGGGATFNPNQPIRRAELAKLLVAAHQNRFGDSQDFCSIVQCQSGHYCDTKNKTCRVIPTCIPWEDLPCPLGGGYGQGEGSSSNPPIPEIPPFTPPSPPPVAECTPGQEQLKLCASTQQATYRLCLGNGSWLPWNPPCPDNTGGGSSGSSGSGGSGSGSSSGGNPSSGSSAGSGGATPICQVSYRLSPTGASCYSNPSTSGSPTICLETSPGSGPQTSWRLCKQGAPFQNSFTYELYDQNHFSHFLGGVQASGSGATCTPWRTVDFSYINQNGPVNGAGLRVELHSPAGCISPACTYYSGITTLYRQCQ